jgi:hypothetical protein
MKDIVETAGLSPGKLSFRLVECFELARQRIVGRRRQHNPTALAGHFQLVAVTHVERFADLGDSGIVSLPRRTVAFGILSSRFRWCSPNIEAYSTVTLFARLRGWSTSVPLMTAVW